MLSFTSEMQAYLIKYGVREHPVLTALRAYTQTIPGANMQISPEQGQFLGFLVSLVQAKHILELGTFTGYSALSMALHLPEDGKLMTCDTNSNTLQIAQNFWQQAAMAHKIEAKLGPALALLGQLPTHYFDIIFIDADKSNYPAYYEKSYDLLKPGGLMIIDNVLWKGEVADPTSQGNQVAAIRELNAKIHEDSRIHCCMLPIRDGLTLVQKINKP